MHRSLPLKDRVYRSRIAGSSVPLTSSTTGTHRLWSQEQMNGAVRAVLHEGMSIRRAAEQYAVPKSSLGDRTTGKVLVDATCGPATYLSAREEEELVVFLTRCAAIGYAKS